MLRLIALTVGLACGIGTAFGADMPTKAPVRPVVQDIYARQGLYVGGGVWGAVGTVNATGPGDISRSIATGAAGQATVGFVKGFGTWFAAVEVSANYSGLSTDNSCSAVAACALSTKIGYEQVIKIGTSNPRIMDWLPSIDIWSIIPGLASAPDGNSANPLAHYYVAAGLREEDISATYGLAGAKKWRNQWEVGVGIISALTPRLSLDKWARYTSAIGTLPVAVGTHVGVDRKILVGVTAIYGIGL